MKLKLIIQGESSFHNNPLSMKKIYKNYGTPQFDFADVCNRLKRLQSHLFIDSCFEAPYKATSQPTHLNFFKRDRERKISILNILDKTNSNKIANSFKIIKHRRSIKNSNTNTMINQRVKLTLPYIKNMKGIFKKNPVNIKEKMIAMSNNNKEIIINFLYVYLIS